MILGEKINVCWVVLLSAWLNQELYYLSPLLHDSRLQLLREEQAWNSRVESEAEPLLSEVLCSLIRWQAEEVPRQVPACAHSPSPHDQLFSLTVSPVDQQQLSPPLASWQQTPRGWYRNNGFPVSPPQVSPYTVPLWPSIMLAFLVSLTSSYLSTYISASFCEPLTSHSTSPFLKLPP